jgi:hypothetical protein
MGVCDLKKVKDIRGPESGWREDGYDVPIEGSKKRERKLGFEEMLKPY